ncbi:ThuA domain-containing protein [Pedobacter jamesrossensis]|uniref:ThuA domain-containing protein n=1 Tax=Pedobacter jamesrossensis TaxID=1908238 RepID=A0ABV8NS05_9SPHI
MKKILSFCFLICAVIFLQSYISAKKIPRILVFSKTKGFRHASIGAGKTAIQKLGVEHNFSVDTTENAALFTEANLKNYAAVIFLSTTGDVLDNAEQAAFERYIQAGGGYVGVHAATDTEYDWPWYGKLAGAYFTSHPAQQEARFVIKDRKHPSTKFMTDSIWMHRDELYNFKDINPHIKVLITIDESSYKGGTNGKFHPFSWYHNFDGGRSFYTSMGHTDEAWKDDKFLKHLYGGIEYAIGGQKKLDYSKARTKLP